MDETSSRRGKRGAKVGDKNPRRIWSVKEEETLILALKHIIQTGWKCENGFRTGYLGVLEHEMLKTFPNTNLKADPHINSKIHVWKKNYGSIVTMLSRSGFGWSDSSNMIVVDDAVWDNYVKVDPNARTMRYKSYPFYPAWLEIFGKERATGEHAEDVADAVQSNVRNIDQTFTGERVPHGLGTSYTDCSGDDNDYMSSAAPDANASHNETSGTEKTGGSSSKKRKSCDPTAPNSQYFEIMNSFCDRTDIRLGEIAKSLRYEYDESESRKAVYEAVGIVEGLTLSQRLWVSKRIVNNTQDMDLFFSIPDDAKIEMVHMFLSNSF